LVELIKSLEVYIIKTSKKPEPKPATLEPVDLEVLFEKPKKPQPKYVPLSRRKKSISEVEDQDTNQSLQKDLGNLTLAPDEFTANQKKITLPDESSDEEFRQAFSKDDDSPNAEIEVENEEQLETTSKTPPHKESPEQPKESPEQSVKEMKKKKVGRPAKFNPAHDAKLKEDGNIYNFFNL
jgi:hypothetical protein